MVCMLNVRQKGINFQADVYIKLFIVWVLPLKNGFFFSKLKEENEGLNYGKS